MLFIYCKWVSTQFEGSLRLYDMICYLFAADGYPPNLKAHWDYMIRYVIYLLQMGFHPMTKVGKLNVWKQKALALQSTPDKNNKPTGKNKRGYLHLCASYAIRQSNVYHVTLTSENMTTFAL